MNKKRLVLWESTTFIFLLTLFNLSCGPNYNNPPATAPGKGSPPTYGNYSYRQTYGDTGFQGVGNGQFESPSGIALYNGALFVADSVRNNIQKFDYAGNYLATYTGGGGGFNGPQGIAFNSLNLMFVADSGNNRIQVLDVNGNYISSFGTVGSGLGQFKNPLGVAVDAQSNVYVADNGNNRVEKSNSAGTSFVTVGGFTNVTALALDSAGNVWVTDTGAKTVMEFSSDLVFLSQFGTAGVTTGQLESPDGIVVDGLGNIIVADSVNANVQQFTTAGAYLTSVGTQGPGSKPGQFQSPAFVAVSGSFCFVGDKGNYTVIEFFH